MLIEQSWGVQLWDQTSNLMKYQETNISLHERMQKFLLEIAKLQSDAFSTQKKLCEKSLVNIKKFVGIETTYGNGFNAFIQAISKLIDTENLMAVSFELNAFGQAKQALDEERARLKKWKQNRERFQSEIKSQTKIIDEEIKRYNEKYREALRSKEEYERVNGDKSCSKLDVEKALNLYSLKHCEFKRARSDYTTALDQFNLYRRNHYTETLKIWGEEGQMIEAIRIAKTQELINVLIERLRVTIDRMNTVCVDLESASALIDADKDTMTLIERLKTGNSPPEDISVIQLSITDPPEVKLNAAGEPVVQHCSSSPNDVQYYASTPVGLTRSASPSNFPGSDVPIEPTETHRLTAPAQFYGSSGGVGRRFGANGNANTANSHSFMSRFFSRKSKSKDVDRLGQEVDTMGRQKKMVRSLSTQETSYRDLEIVHIDYERNRKAMRNPDSPDMSSTSSDEYLGRQSMQENSAPSSNYAQPKSPSFAPVDQKDADKMYAVPSFSVASRSKATSHSPVENKPGAVTQQQVNHYSPKPQNKPDRPPPMQLVPAENRPRYATGENCSPPPHHSAASPDRATTHAPRSSNINAYRSQVTALHRQQDARAGREPRHQNARTTAATQKQSVHQPKRSHAQTARYPNVYSSRSKPISTTKDDLILIGTGTALYDFDCTEFGPSFLSFKTNDVLNLLSSTNRWPGPPDSDGWVYAQLSTDEHQKGFIPSAFVEMDLLQEPIPLPTRLSPNNQIASKNGSIHALNNMSSHYHETSDYRKNGQRHNRGIELMSLGHGTDI